MSNFTASSDETPRERRALAQVSHFWGNLGDFPWKSEEQTAQVGHTKARAG